MGQVFSAADTAAGLEGICSNDKLLAAVAEELQDLAGGTYPEFPVPITWKSELVSEQLKTEKCDAVKFQIESFARNDAGDPLFGFDTGNIKVLNFEWLNHCITAVPDDTLMELKKVLLANADPLTKIVGAGYGDGNDLCEVYGAKGKAPVLPLVVAMTSFNRKLLAAGDVLKADSVSYAAAEVALLKDFSGIDKDRHCLETIDWESSYVSATGCRAPPWRAHTGELGYIVTKPFDAETLTVMVHKDGYWQIKGAQHDGGMNYEKVGETYANLVLFLKAKNPHFAESIKTQATLYAHPETQDAEAVVAVPEEGPLGSKAINATSNRTKRNLNRSLLPSTTWTPLLGETRITASAPSKGGKLDGAGGMSATGMMNLDDDDEDEDEVEVEERRPVANADLPQEYWSILKLIKYLNSGNQTATIIALCSLRDLELTNDACQFAIQDVKGLDILVNLLDAADDRCKIGALQILQDVSLSPQITQAIADLDGMTAMTAILDNPDETLCALAASTMANCAKLARNRRKIREQGGIQKLVKLLHGSEAVGALGDAPDEVKTYALERAGAMALWSCSKSPLIRRMIMAADAVPLLANLLAVEHERFKVNEETGEVTEQKELIPEIIQLLIPIVGIIEECAEDEVFRQMIRERGMVPNIVSRLSVDNEELQALAASAIFKCAEDPLSREIVHAEDGLGPLVALLAKAGNKEMLVGASGAIWKCAMDEASNIALGERAVAALVPLLTEQPEEVLVNVVGALSELAVVASSRKAIRGAGGIDQLVKLLTGTNQALLINVTKAVGSCAQDKDSMAAIEKQDGVRLLWSLLKSPTPEVQSGAAWAICPCIALAPDAGEMVRSFVGGLELIVGLLKSEHIEVLASVCAAVAQIAKDEENLAVITDYGVVPMLGRLTPTTDDRLRRHLASAIAQCCTWGSNRTAFGEADAVAPLVKYLRSSDSLVHRETAEALCQLSGNPENCITMHEAGVVRPLIKLVGSDDRKLQEAAARCIRNIRRLALVNELFKYQ